MGFDELLAMRRVSERVYEATPPGEGFQFGGLTLALALRAAADGIRDDMVPKSFHSNFLRPGIWGEPTRLEVEPLSDGRSFATSQVRVRQREKTLAVVTASFHIPGSGFDWQAVTPGDIPEPSELLAAPVSLPLPGLIDVRPLIPLPEGGHLAANYHPYWARPVETVGEEQVLHYAATTFISDYMVVLSVLSSGMEMPPTLGIRTLDHSVWFHRRIDVDDWLLFSADPTTITGGRGFSPGTVHSRDGSLLASFAQEVIIP